MQHCYVLCGQLQHLLQHARLHKCVAMHRRHYLISLIALTTMSPCTRVNVPAENRTICERRRYAGSRQSCCRTTGSNDDATSHQSIAQPPPETLLTPHKSCVCVNQPMAHVACHSLERLARAFVVQILHRPFPNTKHPCMRPDLHIDQRIELVTP